MSQGDHRVRPKRIGVLEHPFLTLTRWEEQTFDTCTILLRPVQVLTKGSDGAEQQFVLIATNEVIKGLHRELVEVSQE